MKTTLSASMVIVTILIVILSFVGCFEQSDKKKDGGILKIKNPQKIEASQNGLKNGDTLNIKIFGDIEKKLIVKTVKTHTQKNVVAKEEKKERVEKQTTIPEIKIPEKIMIVVTGNITVTTDQSLQKFVDGLNNLPPTLPSWKRPSKKSEYHDSTKKSKKHFSLEMWSHGDEK